MIMETDKDLPREPAIRTRDKRRLDLMLDLTPRIPAISYGTWNNFQNPSELQLNNKYNNMHFTWLL